MPAQRLSNNPIVVGRYDVVASESGRVPGFVSHVGMTAKGREKLRSGGTVLWIEMQPPLSSSRVFPVDAVGWADLTTDEIRDIRMFVEELEREYEAQNRRGVSQYWILPHRCEHREDDNTVTYRRFSCAGFVVEAYGAANIDLVTAKGEALPQVSLEVLRNAYPPPIYGMLTRLGEQGRFGLSGAGPWRILLPGYVLNAMARSAQEIRSEPYRPVAGDEFFPSRR